MAGQTGVQNGRKGSGRGKGAACRIGQVSKGRCDDGQVRLSEGQGEGKVVLREPLLSRLVRLTFNCFSFINVFFIIFLFYFTLFLYLLYLLSVYFLLFLWYSFLYNISRYVGALSFAHFIFNFLFYFCFTFSSYFFSYFCCIVSLQYVWGWMCVCVRVYLIYPGTDEYFN